MKETNPKVIAEAALHNTNGQHLSYEGHFNEAIQHYKAALKLIPDSCDVMNNLAGAFQNRGDMAAALKWYDKASKIEDGDFTMVMINMAGVYQSLGRNDEAVLCLRRAMRRDPKNMALIASMVPSLQSQCSWADWEYLTEMLVAHTKRQLANSKFIHASAFTFQSLPHPNMRVKRKIVENLAKRHQVMAHGNIPGINIHMPIFERPRDRKIRVGYISPDFSSHSLGNSFISLLEQHDPDKFDFYGYSLTDVRRNDDITMRFIEAFNRGLPKEVSHYTEVTGAGHLQIAKAINHDEIDILIDLAGHTKDANMEVLAHRPAPIQCHYLGYSTSTGAKYIDYLITDGEQYGEGEDHWATEKLIRLPETFMAARSYEVSSRKWTRGDCELPRDGFVFANFSMGYKHHPEMFRVWMEILKSVPGSVLWLYKPSLIAERNLTRFAEEHGVGKERLIFATMVDHKDHIGRLKNADLMLDTIYHGGGATTVDALAAGLPCLTLRGRTPPARNGSSILRGANLRGWIVNSLVIYKEQAASYALSNEHKRIDCRNSPLFQPERLARHIEWAFVKMMEIYHAGKSPQKINVPLLF